jgi:hypothetical protein
MTLTPAVARKSWRRFAGAFLGTVVSLSIVARGDSKGYCRSSIMGFSGGRKSFQCKAKPL